MSDLPHMHRRATDECAPAPTTGPPMTEEQLDYFSEQTRCAVDRALNKYMKRAMIGFLLLFIGFLYNASTNRAQQVDIRSQAEAARDVLIESGDVIAIDGCNRDFQTTSALRGVLLASAAFNRQNFEDGIIDRTTLDQRLRFYDDQLDRLPLPDCRKSQGILTDDPQHNLPKPQPLYPDRDSEKSESRGAPPIKGSG
jgi:hypothetical protein